MFWSLPSTSWPSSRARAATPPMKVPAMPRIWSFKISNLCKIAGLSNNTTPGRHQLPFPRLRGKARDGGECPQLLSKPAPAPHPNPLTLGHPSGAASGSGSQPSSDFVRRHDRLDDAGEHIVQRTHAVHHGQLALLAVVIDHRRGLVVVDLQARAHGLRAVVGASLGLGTAGDAF